MEEKQQQVKGDGKLEQTELLKEEKIRLII